MDTKEFKIGDRISFMQGNKVIGTVAVNRDYEPSLGVIWDGFTKICWYITSDGVFKKIENSFYCI